MKDFILQNIKIGMTRDEVKVILGEPHQISIGSRKYPRPCVWKYEDVEIWFAYPKDGGIHTIWLEDESLPPDQRGEVLLK